MAVKELKDFSRGYATDLSPDDLPDNMGQAATNVYYDGKLRKRKGYKTFEPLDVADGEIVGHYFYLLNDLGITFIAYEVSSVITFYTNYSGTMAEVDSSFTWTGTGAVKADVLDGKLILVDESATNKPAILYYDSGLNIESLDTYDSRDIDDPFWYAGQYDASAANKYIDDTVDAQDAGTSDFNMATATDDDGFYIASAKVFSKVVMKTAEQMAGSPVAAYTYWNGTAWTTLTLSTTPTWTAAAGDRTMEFNIPDDWEIWKDDDSVDSGGDEVPGGMTGAYIIRVSFTTHPTAAVDCAYIEVSQTRSVSLTLNNKNATDVVVHNSRVFLVEGNSISYGLYGQAKGFEPYFAEYFEKGGPTINAAVSMQQALFIVKHEAIHKMSGTNPTEFTISTVANKGTPYGKTCAVCKSVLCFSDKDQLFVLSGSTLIEVGEHVKTDVPATAYGAASLEMYWLIASDKILVFDPEQIQTSGNRDLYAPVFKFTNTADIRGIVRYLGVNQFSDVKLYDRIVGYESGTLDLVCLEYGEQFFDETVTTVPITLETKMYSFGLQTAKKLYKRVKPLVSQSGDWTFTIQTRRDEDTVAVTLASGTGGTYYTQDISLPYTVDSDTLSFKFANNTVNDCAIYAVSVDLDLRPY